MAGSYPDVPGYRFAYDVDGTVVVNYNYTTSNTSMLTSGHMLTLNNENPTQMYAMGGNFQTGILAFIFPEIRSVSGFLLNARWATLISVQWSTDTTTGVDGTWTTIPGVTKFDNTSQLVLRDSIQTINVPNISALRVYWDTGGSNPQTRNLHIYGSIAPSETPERLRIVDLSNDDMVAQLDFGNIKQRASSTKQFKVVNNSATQTANSITVSLNAPSDVIPTMIGQYQVSTDNIAFANAVNIGTLAPGAESGTLYVRLDPTSTAQLGPWTARIIAHAVSWS